MTHPHDPTGSHPEASGSHTAGHHGDHHHGAAEHHDPGLDPHGATAHPWSGSHGGEHDPAWWAAHFPPITPPAPTASAAPAHAHYDPFGSLHQTSPASTAASDHLAVHHLMDPRQFDALWGSHVPADHLRIDTAMVGTSGGVANAVGRVDQHARLSDLWHELAPGVAQPATHDPAALAQELRARTTDPAMLDVIRQIVLE